VQLVLQAAALGENGEIFILEMGGQIKIRELAEQMIELSGLRLGEDIEITYTGLRPGEKLSEKLYSEEETIGGTKHQKIYRIMDRILPAKAEFDKRVHELIAFAEKGKREKAQEKLAQLTDL